jgi:hypothetical protein
LQERGFAVGEEVRMLGPHLNGSRRTVTATVTGPATVEADDAEEYTLTAAVGPSLMFARITKIFGHKRFGREKGYELLTLPGDAKQRGARDSHGLELVY